MFNRLAKVLFPVFLFSVSTNATPDSLVGVQGIHIYSQTAPQIERPGITPTHTIRLLDLTDEASMSRAVTEAITATSAMPEQRRALLNFDFDFLALVSTTSSVTDANGDDLAVISADGEVLPHRGIWLDSAMTEVASKVSAFFAQYANAGGELDLVALNYNGLDLSFESIIEAGNHVNGVETYLGEIEADDRFAAIADELGFSDLSALLDETEEATKQRERWNAVMKQRIAAYLNTAFYQPVSAHFPNIQVVANNYFLHDTNFTTEQMTQQFADKEGAVVGNTQASILPAVNDFAEFKASIDTVRGMVLASDKPVYPFIDDSALSDSEVASWYQELLLHSGLSTAGQFVYLNQSSDDAADALLSSTISELAAQVGSGELVLALDNRSLLSENFVLTKAETEAGALWRFTPSLVDGESIDSVVTQSYPAKLSAAGATLSIADTRVSTLAASVADKGIWLESAEPAEIVNCSSAMAVNDRCYAVFSGELNEESKAALALESSEPFTVDESGSAQVLFERQWRTGGADAGLAQQDNFSIRYATSITVEGGEYQYTVAADDTVRLWVDGVLLIDGTANEQTSNRELSSSVNLSVGDHSLVLEYTDIAEEAAVRLSLSRLLPACEARNNSACLFLLNADGESVAVPQTLEQSANGLSFDFDSFELPEGIDPSSLIMRWESVFSSEAGNYDFAIAQGDGNLKIWLDDDLLHEGVSSGNVSIPKVLAAGTHRLRVELQPVAGSFFDVSWVKQVTDCSVIPSNAFCGEFFENRALTGTPAKIQQISAIDFNWGSGAPFDDFTRNNFSARWVGEFEFEMGSYTFRPVTDDGVRVWVDDNLVVDYWRGQGATERPASIWLDEGSHVVKMEYYEGGGSASAKLTWTKAEAGCESVPENEFCAEYYDNNALTGSPVLRRIDQEVDFYWNREAPDPALPVDYFSARWVGDFDFEGGEYNLGLTIDDGARVWVNGVKVFDSWSRGGTFAETFSVEPGRHRVVIDYREWAHGARAQINWRKSSPCESIPENQFCGEFFNNTNLAGLPVHHEVSDEINFDWQYLSPAPGVVPVDHFTVRWEGDFDFEAGKYNFDTSTDDGVRVWVGDSETPIIDSWNRGGNYHAEMDLPAGKHRVKVEYREWGSRARATLKWTKGQFCDTIPNGEFCGEYFVNNSFDGFPVLAKNDSSINFDWRDQSPAPDVVPKDRFSIRWEGDFEFAESNYRFVSRGDDIMRVWVDGDLVIDQPKYNGYKELFHDVALSAGTHRVKVEMVENYGYARANVFWEQKHDCTGTPSGAFCGSYFNNTNLSGTAVRTQLTDKINFSWNDVRPMHGVNNNRYSARWLGKFDFEEGYYKFSGNVDDGVRVWVGDQKVIDQWSINSRFAGNVQSTPWIPAGEHVVKVEYREHWNNANASIDWEPVADCNTTTEDSFCMELYGNRTLSGQPIVVKKVESIANDWKYEKPDDMVWQDSFSARWKGKYNFAEGNYRFTTSTDDGVRLYIDGEAVINKWRYQGETAYSKIVSLEAGQHELMMEYFEGGGAAAAHLKWEAVVSCDEVPTNKFCGDFRNGHNFSSTVLDSQIVDKIDFDWSTQAPNEFVRSDYFSAKWVGKFNFNEGYYKFFGNIDDGVRVWVGDQRIINQWGINHRFDGNVQTTPWISAGEHVVTVEYGEYSGTAKISLDWEAVADCNTAPDDAFCMELYSNRSLSDQPVVVKKVESVANDWKYEKPDDMVWQDSFSARWKGKYNFAEGNYRFTTSTDDGVRLYIDGEAVINKWRYQGETAYEQVVAMEAGEHELQMEYFEGGGAAAAHLSWEPLVSCEEAPEDKFCGEFFDSRDLTGTIVDSQFTDKIDFDWTNQAPNEFVNRDKFSARWKGSFQFDGGLYRFLTDFDDGMRVKVDGELIIDGWTRKWPYYGKLRQLHRISEGRHTVEVEYREDWGNASAKLWWEKAPDCETVAEGKFCAEFFEGTDLNDEKLIDTRFDDAINFDWGGGYPYEGANVPRDRFSVRWQGAFDFTEGEYTFNVRTDDGFRLWVDDALLIDSWKPQGATNYSKRLVLEPGRHIVKAEYYEATGGAVAKLNWTLDQANQPKKPESLTATEVLQNRAVLTWNTEELVKEYRILRDGEALTTVTAGTLVDNSVEVTKEHSYQVIARWANGRESEAATVKVTIPDTDLPTVPQSLRVADVTAESVSLVWDASTDNVAIAGYKLLRDGVEVSQAVGNGIVDEGLTSFSQHRYQVVAFDAAGNTSAASDTLTVFTKDSVSPTVPGSVSSSLNSDGNIALSWGAARDNVGVASYAILRDGEQIATTSQTRYVDTTAAENTNYQYQIVALDSSGNESSASVALSIMSGDVTAPAAPDSLTGSVVSSEAIALEWEAAVDNKGVVAYKVLRDGRSLATSTRTSYTDSQVEAGYQYAYEVKAVDAAGNTSLASNSVELGISQICRSTESTFEAQLADSLTASCATCHTAGGMAQATRLILSGGDAANDADLLALNTLVQQLDKAHILNKASGVLSHGGGAAFAQGSEDLQVLDTVLSELSSPASCSDAEPVHTSNILTDSLVSNCYSCHGTFGQSSGPATPTVSGMKSAYIAKVMKDYQTGDRASTVMDRIAKGYTSDEIARIADVLAKQPYSAAEQTVDAGLAELGQALHLDNCASCHTSDGRSDFWTGSRLAGQWAPYLEQTLMDYAQGRSQGPAEMQTSVDAIFAAEGETGIKALAAFYASVQADSEAPEVPDFVSVAAYTSDSITLTWMDSDDDWGVALYEIYRDGVLVGKTKFNTFTDTGLSTGNYQYTILAVDIADHKSVASEVVSATLSTDSASPDGISLLDYQSTLRKSALLLLGRLPTDEEMMASDTEEGFRQILSDMMAVDGSLDTFAYRAGHEVFLSRGASSVGGTGGLRMEDFPAVETLTRAERNAATTAVREEPIYLMQHILDNNRPWTEMLTADYTVVNPASAKVFDVTLLDEGFTDDTDMSERRRAKINKLSARFADKAFPHAGVLTTNAWLSRFPTTDTNRNRHRSAKLFKQFLGVDIEALAQRPLDDSNNGDFLVPTMENPNCMTCHTVMDPVAGAFKNWSYDNRYARNFNGERGDKDSLSRSYKSSNYPMNHQGQSWYHSGDTWYRDMLMPGMNDKVMPGAYGEYGAETLTASANLLENPSAEAGISGWTMVSGTMEAVNQESCERVTVDARGGDSLFQLGQCTEAQETVLAIQEVDVEEHAADIDAGSVKLGFGAYFRSKQNRDTPSIWVTFLDASGEVIAESETLSDRRTWSWRNRIAEQVVPENTRRLRFNMQGQRSGYRWADEYVDAYIDDVYMQIHTPTQNVESSDTSIDSLQWLGQQMVQDSRFAKGSVYFWYRSLFKREPLSAPIDPDADDYSVALAAYNEQDAIIDGLARRFARDNGNGAWNVKDLLIDMVASPLFRASEGQLSEEEQATLSDIGLSRLLTPEELNRKLKAITGYEWRSFQETRAWSDRMGLFYGGFDGGRLQTSANTEMNSMMSKIPERMAIEMSCNMVYGEFRKGVADRGLLKFVEASDTPAYEDVSTMASNMLVNPGAEEGMTGWVLETGAARILSGARGCNGGPSIHSGEAIFNPGGICSSTSALGRLYQDVDVTAWAEVIDQGDSQALFGAAIRSWSTNNDEASVFLSFRDSSGNELGGSEVISTVKGVWNTSADFADVPVGTRVIRYVMQGRRLSTHANNDSFVDDTYLRLLLPDSDYMPAGERRIRENLQYLHQRFLNEPLALDAPELDRTFNLFSDIWAERSETDNMACRLYNEWEDPNYTKRAWTMVMMYLMTDARFLHE